jgi:RNA polymerase sigma factor for flagellar operon FliA
VPVEVDIETDILGPHVGGAPSATMVATGRGCSPNPKAAPTSAPPGPAAVPRVDPASARDPHDLWEAYLESRSVEARNALARHYAPLLRSVAMRMLPGPGRYVDLEDLEAFGFFGLCDAIERFNPSLGYAFSTLAVPRIRGSIIDHLRSMDPASRTVRAQVKLLDSTTDSLVLELERQPTVAEIAARMETTPDKVEAIQLQAMAAAPVSLDTPGPDGSPWGHQALGDARAAAPSAALESAELSAAVAQAISKLRDNERYVIVEHWFHSRRYADIAEDLGVTESRVCQIHTAALGRLRQSRLISSHYWS